MAAKTSGKRGAAPSTKKPRKNAKQTSKQTSGATATSDQEIEELVFNEARALQKEVLEAQVGMAWEAVESVDGFDQHKARDKELWEEVERVAKTSQETTKRTSDNWKVVEKRWGQDLAKRLTRLGTGHHFSRALVRLIKQWLPAETAIRRANRCAFKRITNIKQGSRGGVHTIPKDFKAATDEHAKDTKLTEEELAGIRAKLDSYGLIIPIDEEEEAPLLQDSTGLEALGWFDKPLLPIEEQPQVLVLNEPTVRKASPSASVLKSPPASPTTSNPPSAAPATSNSTPCNPPTSQSTPQAPGQSGPLGPLPSPCRPCFDRWMSVNPSHPLYDLPDCVFSSKRGRCCDECAKANVICTLLPDAVLHRLPRLLHKKSRLERGHRRFLKELRYFDRWMSIKPSHPLYDLPDCFFSSLCGRCCDECAKANVICTPVMSCLPFILLTILIDLP